MHFFAWPIFRLNHLTFSLQKWNKEVAPSGHFLSSFKFSQPQEPSNLLYGLKIGFCIISRCNGISYKIWTTRILTFFWKLLPFQFFDIYSNYSGFWASGVRKPPLGFDSLENFCWSWIIFQLYHEFMQFFKIFAFFSFFFEFLPAPGALGPPPRFDNKLMHSYWS